MEDKPAAKNEQAPIDEHEKSSEVVHFNSKGESIEKEKSKIKAGAAACKVPAQDLPVERPKEEKPKLQEIQHNNIEGKQLHSSSVDEHAIRFDHHGNTKEEYKDSVQESPEEEEEAPKRKKKKKEKKKKISESSEVDKKLNIRKKINEDVVKKQLQIRDLANEDSDDINSEEDDIPLITIPMVDILKQYQRMAQGFESSTEEYSDEQEEKENHLENPHLLNALNEISVERKKVKKERKEGKTGKPAAQRLFGDASESEEEL